MKRFVDHTLKQTVLVNIVFVLLMVVGVFCVFDIAVDRYPNVQMGKVIISGFLPGAGPSEVEAMVTRKIEDSLEDLENVEYVRSRSYREHSSVLVKFLDDTDYDHQFDELRFKVLSIQNDLPPEMDPPHFTKIDVDAWLPVVSVNLVGDRSNRSLTLMAEEMKIPLKRISGVKEVEVQGEYTREYHVVLDPLKMTRMGVTFDEVAAALENANVSIPAGDYENRDGEYVILVDERFRERSDVATAIVRRDKDGSFVTVGDVMSGARVSYRDPQIITSVNGQPCVNIKVVKTSDGNALEIAADVEELIARYELVLEREGVRAIITQDQRVYIDESMSTLGMNLMVGMILVSLSIWLVMGLRNAVLTTVGVPFSFLVTMILMWLTDNSLNEVTLFSFVLVTGIIVDDAIVVVENIFRHLQEGKPLRQAVVDGTSEVFLAVVAATSTTVASFLPMLIMTGSTGEFFSLVPKAVAFAIIASLVECLIILPAHFMEWPGLGKVSRGAEFKDPAFMESIRNLTDRFLVRVIRRKWLSLATVFVSFVMAIIILGVSLSGVAPLIRIQFFPDDYNLFYVDVVGPESSSINESAKRADLVAQHVAQLGPGVAKSATAMSGMVMNKDYETVFGSNLAMVTVEMPAKEDWAFPGTVGNDPQAYLEWMRAELEPFADDGWSIRVWPEQTGPPAGKDVNIRVLGPDMEGVVKLATAISRYVRENTELQNNLHDIAEDTGTPNRIFRFEPDQARIAEYGLTPRVVAYLAGSVLDGRYVGKFRLGDEDVDMKLSIDPNRLEQPEQALEIPVLEHSEGPVRLGDLCGVDIYREPGQLNRFQGQRAVTITADIIQGSPISAAGVVRMIREHYQTIRDQHPGAALNFAGEYESTGKSFSSLGSAFLIAMMCIYMILATKFQSYAQPMIIMSSVGFALVGVIFGVFLTRSLFTINSFVATVGVAGVVVNDSLVLLEFINNLYAKGMTREEAMRQGVRVRLRPILLTTLTTTLGLLPMAVGIPYYSNVWGTMATTFVTGLCTATALTIFMVPIEWDLLIRFTEWRNTRQLKGEQEKPSE